MTMRIGSSGTQVKQLQQELRAAGYKIEADGIFGKKTLAAVKQYQAQYKLDVDGIVGPKTMKALRTDGFDPPKTKPKTDPPKTDGPDSAPKGKGTAAEMLRLALAQKGDKYVYGAEVKLNDKNPDTFDCSELVQWAVHQAGGSIPDGSQAQRGAVKKISVAEAARTPGALLFNGHHVAISVGDGVHTIEAMGSKWGVCTGTIKGRFEDGGLVKGLKY